MDGYYGNLAVRCLSLGAILAFGACGCSSFKSQMTPKLGSQVLPPEDGQAGAAKTNSVFIEFHPTSGQPKLMEQKLTDSKHVQDMLTESKALKYFNRADLELIRTLPNGGRHRMQIEYSHAQRRIDPEFDYVLHPGDHIIVKENTETFLDDALEAALKPLGLDGQIPHGRSKKSSKYIDRS